jgi:hypothetical protein
LSKNQKRKHGEEPTYHASHSPVVCTFHNAVVLNVNCYNDLASGEIKRTPGYLPYKKFSFLIKLP